ncbi:response regulator [Burkholderia sp. AW33-5]
MGKFSVRIVFASECPLVIAGIKYVAINSGVIDLVGTCTDTAEMLALLADTECDVVIVDFDMRGGGNMEGVALLGYLRRTYPGFRIVVLLGHESPVVMRAILAAGVSSVVSKQDEGGHIIAAIHSAYCNGNYLSPKVKAALESAAVDTGRGGRWLELTPREVEVVRLYLSGLSIKGIAERLSKGKQTVSAQKVSAMKKLGVENDIELFKCAARLNLIY